VQAAHTTLLVSQNPDSWVVLESACASSTCLGGRLENGLSVFHNRPFLLFFPFPPLILTPILQFSRPALQLGFSLNFVHVFLIIICFI
jgi:hypothetical protein